jgi:hypothetical protein
MSKVMTRVEEIKSAVAQLPRSELINFGEWFRRFEAQVWDAQLDGDVKAGKLNRVAEEALTDFKAGRCTEL